MRNLGVKSFKSPPKLNYIFKLNKIYYFKNMEHLKESHPRVFQVLKILG